MGEVTDAPVRPTVAGARQAVGPFHTWGAVIAQRPNITARPLGATCQGHLSGQLRWEFSDTLAVALKQMRFVAPNLFALILSWASQFLGGHALVALVAEPLA